MLTRELLSQVHRLEIKTRRLVNEIFSGQYGSVFRGLGMEFAEVREYVPGDEVRSIDWNVTARMGHPYIKKFMAEREMTVMLVVDGSASLRFGTAMKWKSELAAEVAAVLGFSAIRNSDKVGLLLFSDQVEKFIRPQKGRTHTLRLVRDILEYTPKGTATDLEEALRYVNGVMKRKAVVFLLSDFAMPPDRHPLRPLAGDPSSNVMMDPRQGHSGVTVLERLLAVTGKRHDLIALQVLDPREETLPDAGLVELFDAETDGILCLDSSRRQVRQQFEDRARARQRSIAALFRRHGIDHIVLRTDRSFVSPLLNFFKTRVKRFR